MSERDESRADGTRADAFVPRGAVAFMVFMILTYGATWLFFYFLMVGRG